MADAALATVPELEIPPAPDEVPLLEAVGISKLYGDFVANDAINLEIWPAEVHALLGENGAGKSTLVKMIYGLLQPSAGEFRWQGEPVVLAGPAAARARGIGMVFQHFSLFEQLTVAENVALGLDNAPLTGIEERVSDVSKSYGLPLDPRREVWRLSVGERQRIEIVRCLLQDPKLLILDEPTSVLTPQEAEQLFRTLRVLRKEGRAILYISHKLEEVRALCDTATILRGGKVIATCDPRAETAQSLARMMVGGEVGAVRSDGSKKLGQPRLVVRDLNFTPDDPHGVKLDGVTFDLAAGEILGLAGVAGNGQDELFAVLSGESLAGTADAIKIDGRDAGKLSITERRRLGAAFVPEERLGHATAPRFTLSNNALISGHAASPMVRRGFIDRGQTLAFVERITKAYDVRKAKADPEAMSLSGGNLQKYVVGREILREPRLLIVSQPTWGVDAGAAAAIRQAIIDLAGRGAAVLVMSQDLDELYEISDRLVVMCAGRLSAPRATRRADRGEIGMLMAGVGMKGAANAARA
jgi:simple sugar transport system ATP-binding protein